MPVIKIPYSQSESIMTCKYDRTLGSSSGTHVSSPPPFIRITILLGWNIFFVWLEGFGRQGKVVAWKLVSASHPNIMLVLTCCLGDPKMKREFSVCACVRFAEKKLDVLIFSCVFHIIQGYKS